LRLYGGGIDYFFAVQRDVTERASDWGTLQRETQRVGDLFRSSNGDRDPITGALNHRRMLLRPQHLLDGTQTPDSITGVVALQFKRLHRFNQVFGFEAINQLLGDINERLSSRLEAGESVARLHEHTFAVLIPIDTQTAGDADRHLIARAHALLAAVMDEGFEVGGAVFELEVGAGIASAPTDSADADELAIHADAAAQRTAAADADPVRWADRSTVENQRQQLAVEWALRRAVNNRELAVVFQPIVDLGSTKVVGAEALVRWPQPDGKPPVSPNEFIPVAENLGLMHRLGMQVFEQACRQLWRWQQWPGNRAFWVSVNVAPTQLQDPNLADRFLAMTRGMGVSPACIKLEITESALEADFETLSDVIDKLVAAGFLLALDDFGTGYSSLGRLIELPFSVLKVDRTFVWQTPSGRGAGVVSSLSQLSDHLELNALGEGVETADHEAYLRACGYTYAQGYYYGQPVPACDFAIS